MNNVLCSFLYLFLSDFNLHLNKIWKDLEQWKILLYQTVGTFLI